MWYKLIIDRLIGKIKEKGKAAAQEFLQVFWHQFHNYIFDAGSVSEFNKILAIIDKIYDKFGQRKDKTVSLQEFSSYLVGLSIVYIKMGDEQIVWNSSFRSIIRNDVIFRALKLKESFEDITDNLPLLLTQPLATTAIITSEQTWFDLEIRFMDLKEDKFYPENRALEEIKRELRKTLLTKISDLFLEAAALIVALSSLEKTNVFWSEFLTHLTDSIFSVPSNETQKQILLAITIDSYTKFSGIKKGKLADEDCKAYLLGLAFYHTLYHSTATPFTCPGEMERWAEVNFTKININPLEKAVLTELGLIDWSGTVPKKPSNSNGSMKGLRPSSSLVVRPWANFQLDPAAQRHLSRFQQLNTEAQYDFLKDAPFYLGQSEQFDFFLLQVSNLVQEKNSYLLTEDEVKFFKLLENLEQKILDDSLPQPLIKTIAWLLVKLKIAGNPYFYKKTYRSFLCLKEHSTITDLLDYDENINTALMEKLKALLSDIKEIQLLVFGDFPYLELEKFCQDSQGWEYFYQILNELRVKYALKPKDNKEAAEELFCQLIRIALTYFNSKRAAGDFDNFNENYNEFLNESANNIAEEDLAFFDQAMEALQRERVETSSENSENSFDSEDSALEDQPIVASASRITFFTPAMGSAQNTSRRGRAFSDSDAEPKYTSIVSRASQFDDLQYSLTTKTTRSLKLSSGKEADTPGTRTSCLF